ncbi:MAG: NUDIX domain-containing protein [Planctomycetota bacterium]
MARDPFGDFRAARDFLGAFGYLETERGVLLVANRRRIGGESVVVWDLPGGGVEEGETLAEGLVREMREETALDVEVAEMLFVAEGERVRAGCRVGVWRSFFFRVERTRGEIDLSGEPDLVDYRFEPVESLPPLLTAPYHRGFCAWLASGGRLRHTFDRWVDRPPR